MTTPVLRDHSPARSVTVRLLLVIALWVHGLGLLPARASPPSSEGDDDDAIMAGTVRRFVLVVGANDGGEGRDRLRYAGTDASSLAGVMRDLGGVNTGDRTVLMDPTPAQLRRAFVTVGLDVAKAKASGDKVQFFFYYSGHSDDRGLLLGGVTFSYKELRQMIDGMPSNVRIGVLDSCSSGAFTRLKGGKKRPPLLTTGAAVEGHAYLTSSSADEAAQESDRIGGSFFTHFFVTGLRGAADINRDGLVTLNEAYRFAFDETLARTEATVGGAQHAAYEIQLTGSGDLVMTDLRETSALLELDDALNGRVYVRDGAGNLEAELYKPAGRGPVLLALEPGRYRVTVDDGNQLLRANVVVQDGTPAPLSSSELSPVRPEVAVARGDDSGVPAQADQLEPAVGDGYRTVEFNAGLTNRASINGRFRDAKIINHFSLSLFSGRNAKTWGVATAFGSNQSAEELRGLQWSFGHNYAGAAQGVQATFGANVARTRTDGIQAAVGANITHGALDGLQIAHGYNRAGAGSEGIQFGAIVNHAPQGFRGGQVGLVNVSNRRFRGAQIGLVSYAPEADAQLSLIGVTKQGGAWADVWTGDTAAINLAVRLRARYTYTFLSAGLHPAGAGAGWRYGAGFGGHIKLGQRLFIEIDLGTYGWHEGFDQVTTPSLLNELRVMFGGRVAKRFAIYGGPTANAIHRFDGRQPELPGYAFGDVYSRAEENYRARFWPGFVFGFEF